MKGGYIHVRNVMYRPDRNSYEREMDWMKTRKEEHAALLLVAIIQKMMTMMRLMTNRKITAARAMMSM